MCMIPTKKTALRWECATSLGNPSSCRFSRKHWGNVNNVSLASPIVAHSLPLTLVHIQDCGAILHSVRCRRERMNREDTAHKYVKLYQMGGLPCCTISCYLTPKALPSSKPTTTQKKQIRRTANSKKKKMPAFILLGLRVLPDNCSPLRDWG